MSGAQRGLETRLAGTPESTIPKAFGLLVPEQKDREGASGGQAMPSSIGEAARHAWCGLAGPAV